MRSEDVIHSLYIPSFRMKMDVVPGRYAKMWFTPTELGEHHGILRRVLRHGPLWHAYQSCCPHAGGLPALAGEETDKEAEKADPVELGKKIYETRGCATCHSIDGSRLIGPTFKGAFGREETLSDGSKITVDEAYIHESIIDPQAKIVAGYAPVMPTFKGKLKDVEIHGVVEFIKSLK